MLYIELIVNRESILEDIQGILRLFVSFASLSSLYHDICDSVSDRRRCGLISLTHPLSQLHVGLLRNVLLPGGGGGLRFGGGLI